jgi:phenylpropionate dioxygenase-like ring-hydroxylating dioxygenase large terminal subunit
VSAVSFPASSLPRGWFVVSWSHDLKPGEVKPLEYFGEKLVIWRGDSGEVFLQDAFCLHLGAHRGIRGWVTGDDLNCPWHGWVWNGEGRNVNIPYSKENCKPRLKIKTYPVREWCGAVIAWFDWVEDGEPQWEMPYVAEYDDAGWYPMHPVSSLVNRIKAHPQMPQENAVDPAHIFYVHGSSETPTLSDTYTDGHIFRSKAHVLYGGGKESTRLTPDGPVNATFESIVYGIGISLVYWRDVELVPTVQLTAFTPVGDGYIDYWFAQTSIREEGDSGAEPTGRAGAMLRTQHKVIPQDFFTWENMKYLDKPNLAVEEAKNYALFRKWALQFYPDSDHEAMVGANPDIEF